MNTALWLQLACLALLWLQLLLQGQLQTVVAIGLPLLLLLRLRPRPLPRSVLLGLTAGLVLLWATGASLADRSGLLQGACNLLWLLSGLKLLEARSHNEHQRLTVLLLLSVGLAGVTAQSLAASLGQGICALLTLTALLSLEAGPERLGRLLRRSGLLMGLALPVLVTAFVLLPRLEPLWSLQVGGQGRTGLSQRLAPGALARLVQDDSLAARVSFANGSPPLPAQRYWRVLVHQRFDGSSWSAQPSIAASLLLGNRKPPGVSPIVQRWLVEPSGLRQRPWDGQGQPRPNAPLRPEANGTLTAAKPLIEREMYVLQRGPEVPLWQQIPPSAADLEVPTGVNPQLQNLGQQWGRQAPTAEDRLQLAREWYLQQGFRYTLEPGSLDTTNPLDGFLFKSRAGFCEHFAASFAALMRSAGVPARVIVGYQGGSWQQPLGGTPYLELRNSDAHAWSEIWLPGRGWVGVDPTAWVVPERVRRPLADSLSPADQQRLSRPTAAWFEAAAAQWRGLDYRWQLLVMDFDRQRQLDLLGDSRWQGLKALGAMALALGLGLLPLVWTLRPQNADSDQGRRQLLRLLNTLKKRGHHLGPGESLDRFCHRIAAAEPQLASGLAELCHRYSQWRFDPAADGQLLQDLLETIRALQLLLAHDRRPTA